MATNPYQNDDVNRVVVELSSKLDGAYAKLDAYLRDKLKTLTTEDGLIVRDAGNIAKIQAIINEVQAKAHELGIGDAISAQGQGLLDLSEKILDKAGNDGISSKFSATTGEEIKALITGAQRDMVSDEVALARAIEKTLIRSTTGSTNLMDLVDSVLTQVDRSKVQMASKSMDAVAMFNNQVRREHYEEAGVEWFLYDGPVDERTRPFCQRFAGKRVTAEMLDSCDNGHPVPASISLGGYNCRHDLVPISDPKDLARYEPGKPCK